MEWRKYKEMMIRYGIDTVRRQIDFLAQCSHESMSFTRFVENMNYSANGMADTWPRRYAKPDGTPNDLALRLHRHPEAIANNCYANRNGNGDESTGDGFKLRGHGFMMLTGRDNIQGFADSVHMSLDEALEYMRTEAGAMESACYFWKMRGCNKFSDNNDFVGLTKRVNGGTVGINNRLALRDKYTKELTA